MLALARLVHLGRAVRPPLHAYLQHDSWRKIWTHILDTAGFRPADEFAALRAMQPLEEEFMRRVALGTQSHELQQAAADQKDGDDLDAGLARLIEESGLAEDYLRRKYVSYALVLANSGQELNWNDDIDDFAREIGALSEEEIESARVDLHQAILNRVRVALVTEGAIQGSNASAPESSRDSIRVPGVSADITIPRVSFASADSEEELQRLYLTACSGAANLLVPLIQQRSAGAASLQVYRACALDMVLEGHAANLAPSRDTDGLFLAGRTLFETRWKEWSEAGDPLRALLAHYEEQDE